MSYISAALNFPTTQHWKGPTAQERWENSILLDSGSRLPAAMTQPPKSFLRDLVHCGRNEEKHYISSMLVYSFIWVFLSKRPVINLHEWIHFTARTTPASLGVIAGQVHWVSKKLGAVPAAVTCNVLTLNRGWLTALLAVWKLPEVTGKLLDHFNL